MRLADELLILLLSHHHDAFFALPRDALRAFRSRPAEDLAEACFGALDLPGVSCRFEAGRGGPGRNGFLWHSRERHDQSRSEEHTSELQSPCNLVCRLLL